MLYAAMSRGRDLDKSLVKSVVSLQKKVPVVYALAAPRRPPLWFQVAVSTVSMAFLGSELLCD